MVSTPGYDANEIAVFCVSAGSEGPDPGAGPHRAGGERGDHRAEVEQARLGSGDVAEEEVDHDRPGQQPVALQHADHVRHPEVEDLQLRDDAPFEHDPTLSRICSRI